MPRCFPGRASRHRRRGDVRRVLKWRLRHDKVTTNGSLPGRKGARAGGPGATPTPELMASSPPISRRRPRRLQDGAHYDVHFRHQAPVPADQYVLAGTIRRSRCPEERQRIEQRRRQHDEWLARTKDERDAKASGLAVEDGEYPSPPSCACPIAVLAR